MRVLVIAATAVFVTNFCYFFCCDVTCFMYVWPRPLPPVVFMGQIPALQTRPLERSVHR